MTETATATETAPDADDDRAARRARGQDRRAYRRVRRDEPRRRRHGFGWWAVRGLLALLALLIVLVVVVQLVLWSAYPKSLVLSQLEKSLGLRAEAESLSAGWFGNTTLRNVKLSLPLAEGSVLDVPVMRVKTNWLLGIVLSGAEIRGLELVTPTLHVSQDAAGRWNVAEVLELLARTGGKKEGQENAAQATSTEPPKLPRILIQDATVVITDNAKRTQTLNPVTVRGVPEGNLLWNYSLAIPNHVAMDGRLVPGGDWRHEVTAQVREVSPWLKPWMPEPPPFAFDGRWEGRTGAGGVNGRLRLDGLVIGPVAAKGMLGVATEAGATVVRPESLTLDLKQEAGKAAATSAQPVAATAPPGDGGTDKALSVTTSGGRIVLAADRVAAEQLQVLAMGGVVQVDGQFVPGTGAGQASATWAGVAAPHGASHNGSLTAKIGRRLDGGPTVDATVDSRGTVSGRSYTTKLVATAYGADWKNLSGRLTVPDLDVTGQPPVSLDGLVVDAQTTTDPATAATTVSLTSIRLPDQERLTGRANYNLASGEWKLNLDGRGWAVPHLLEDTLAFRVEAMGNRHHVDLPDLTLRVEDLAAKLFGQYVYDDPNPVQMKLAVSHRPEPGRLVMLRQSRAANLNQAQQRLQGGAKPPAPDFIRGMLAGQLDVTGTLDPMKVGIRGNLNASELAVQDRWIGDIAAKVDGYVLPDRAEVKTDTLQLLGGSWDLSAFHSFDTSKTTVSTKIRGLPLAQVAAAAKQDDVAGTIDAHLMLETPGLKTAAGGLQMSGWVNGKDLKAYGLTVDAVALKPLLEDGRLTVPIEAFRTQDGVKGSAHVSVSTLVADRKQIEVRKLALKDWPLPAGPLVARASGGSDLITVDLPDREADKVEEQRLRVTSPTVYLSTAFRLGQADAGRVETYIGLRGRVYDVRSISGTLLGATVRGQSIIDLDQPLLAAGEVSVTGLRAAEVAGAFPAAKSVSGTYDVRLRLAPARADAVALEPLVLDVDLKSRDAQYAQAVEIGDARFRAYANLDPNWGWLRFVLADAPEAAPSIPPAARPGVPPAPVVRPSVPAVNTMHVAGGVVRVWGRVVRNEDELGIEGATSLSTHVKLSFNGLVIDQVVHAGAPEAGEMPGFVNGNVVLFGGTRVKDARGGPQGHPTPVAATQPVEQMTTLERLLTRLSGSGAVELQQADLANFSVASGLYDAMRLGATGRDPNGNGSATFRIENNALYVTGLRYFNRGVDARGQATVRDLRKIPQSPVEATVIGSIRPFKDIDLPLFGDVDKLLTAIQTSSTAIQVGGTVRDPQIAVVPFEALGQGIRQFLAGDISAEVRGSAGQ